MNGNANGRTAWLLMTDEGDNENPWYGDQLGVEYLYDSKVQNHQRLSRGDPIALWDRTGLLLGISVVEDIDSWPGTKTLRRCRECGATRPSERSTMHPRFRCSRCRAEFDTPRLEKTDVTMFTARYDAAWTSLDGVLSKAEIRPFIKAQGSFNSIRELDWHAFQQALADKGAGRAIQRVIARVPDLSWPTANGPRIELAHGFNQSVVRVRRGQRQFREQILAAQGSNCAFTGAAPARVLEAGHLYRYAQLGKHYEHGGLMLRRDVHRLFDDELLAVTPTLPYRIDVAPDLADYPQYDRLHGEPLMTQLRAEQVEWLDKHWYEHRDNAQEAHR
ncbi:HNH endonuclease [Promicromonospora vindobonensis]|uniref:HNH endonuclease n=1 Tax=Promicromonospora vindobonensis TaxID=195748 RepID=A0ABW5VMM6_9MICO